jgi:hypothetical protein
MQTNNDFIQYRFAKAHLNELHKQAFMERMVPRGPKATAAGRFRLTSALNTLFADVKHALTRTPSAVK